MSPVFLQGIRVPLGGTGVLDEPCALGCRESGDNEDRR